MKKYQVLKTYFGHDTFRPGQEELIDALAAGRDALGVMPTGGGKSLCYQVPAIMGDGLALVISPLISLMQDQVMALKAQGVAAAYWNSSLDAQQQSAVFRRLRQGAYQILYVAPERLLLERFVDAMQALSPGLVAVDEAHCISQWGQDFRPSYLQITEFLEQLPRRPVVGAFTATATQAVRKDILRILQLRDPLQVVTGFDRPNLFFDVLQPKRKDGELLRLLGQRAGRSGIVYCATRASVEEVCQMLNQAGISATRYHAGLEDAERQANQDAFQYDRVSVMVATNAFGMGIDKSNVSFVIHYNMPKSLEAYYQEAGRAGRDGEPADCILLYGPKDVEIARFFIENNKDNELLSQEQKEEVLRQDRRRLDAMVRYCRTSRCLRGHILDYFGQAHEATCANCGNCRGDFALEDVTVPAQMILSCVRRVRDRLGYPVGRALIVDVLRGSRSQRVQSLGLNGLSTYGLMGNVSKERIRSLMDHLQSEGYLRTEPEHRTLLLTGRATEVLFQGQKIRMPVKKAAPEASAVSPEKQPASPQPVSMVGNYDQLFHALKAVRNRLAQEAGVPAYVVFSNATLADMAVRLPRTQKEFLQVNGVGEYKAKRYGDAFLAAIREFWVAENSALDYV